MEEANLIKRTGYENFLLVHTKQNQYQNLKADLKKEYPEIKDKGLRLIEHNKELLKDLVKCFQKYESNSSLIIAKNRSSSGMSENEEDLESSHHSDNILKNKAQI
jgi:hypothetical protein